MDISMKSLCSQKQILHKKGCSKALKPDNSYTGEEWVEMYHYLFNVDIHLDKAIYDRNYSMSWVFAMLHFFLFWRSADFSKFPSPDLKVIGIDNLKDFKWQDLKLCEAEKIINDIGFRCKEIYIAKTGAKVSFVIDNNIQKQLAMAIIIAELHREQHKGCSLIEKEFCNNYLKRVDELMIRIGSSGLKFRSAKARRTLCLMIRQTSG